MPLEGSTRTSGTSSPRAIVTASMTSEDGSLSPRSTSDRNCVETPERRETTQFLRSEEHTSELQSRFDLVCRLLLEKKKQNKNKKKREYKLNDNRLTPATGVTTE